LKKIRAFLSLNLEDSLKTRIAETQKELQSKLGGHLIKWENPEKFHLTVRFFGDVSEEVLGTLKIELGQINWDFDLLEFNSNGIGFFPNSRRPNVVFIGLDEKGNNSEQFVKEIDKVTAKFGILPDKKFVAHITLGRFRRENRKGVDENNLVKFEPFMVNFDSFYLMESVLGSKGSIYYPIKQFNFEIK
jgi:2'-5' RNA ligase